MKDSSDKTQSPPEKQLAEDSSSPKKQGGEKSSADHQKPAAAPESQTGSGSGSASRVGGAGGISIGGGGEQGGGSGSTAVATAGRGPGGGGRGKRKAEIIGPVGVEMVCSVCKRDFGSWKALSGHMRSHPERQWRGIFPPPVEPRFAAAQAPVREERVALDVDLNQPQREEEERASPPPDAAGGAGAFDLNKPPASGDGEE